MAQQQRLPKLWLLSKSAARKQLLLQVGYKIDRILPSAIDEGWAKNELPNNYAKRMAASKLAIAMAKCDSPATVVLLAADTVVACGRRILSKPENMLEASENLQLLSGRQHRVYCGIAIHHAGRTYTRLSTTKIVFKRLSAMEVDTYLASREWCNSAGGYAIQGRAAAFVRSLQGSYSAVVGLPLYETCNILSHLLVPSAPQTPMP